MMKSCHSEAPVPKERKIEILFDRESFIDDWDAENLSVYEKISDPETIQLIEMIYEELEKDLL